MKRCIARFYRMKQRRTATQWATADTHCKTVLHHARAHERADKLASTTDITSGLQLGWAEVLRGLKNFLNMDRPEHHSTDRLKERGVKKGCGRHSNLRGREQCVFNQTTTGTVSRVTLGRLLGDGASAFGPFRAVRCHLKLKLKNWNVTRSLWHRPLQWRPQLHAPRRFPLPLLRRLRPWPSG